MIATEKTVKTLVQVEVTTFGHERHRKKTLIRLMKELKLQGFNVKLVGTWPGVLDG